MGLASVTWSLCLLCGHLPTYSCNETVPTSPCQVIDDNLNPVWNEYFEFVLQSSPRPLVFTVKDSDRIGKNEVRSALRPAVPSCSALV